MHTYDLVGATGSPGKIDLDYLDALNPLLTSPDWRSAICLGDFNQRIPASRVPQRVHEALASCIQGWEVATSELTDPDGKRAIDHIIHRGAITTVRVVAEPRFADDGTRLSDHFGVVAELHPHTGTG